MYCAVWYIEIIRRGESVTRRLNHEKSWKIDVMELSMSKDVNMISIAMRSSVAMPRCSSGKEKAAMAEELKAMNGFLRA